MTTASAGGGAGALRVDLGSATSLARRIGFDGTDPRHFGAAAPRRWPLSLPGFSGEVRSGASCNCATLELTPHCNGTHTESVAHLVVDPQDVCELAPLGPLPALLLSLATERADRADEDSDPAPRPGDRLLTRAALRAAWPIFDDYGPIPDFCQLFANCACNYVGATARSVANKEPDRQRARLLGVQDGGQGQGAE